eukprot:m.22769 g.22769  ORF g.22769 m.22769 type:complete len:445 (-) comp9368_c0_seq2:113-1447(-)
MNTGCQNTGRYALTDILIECECTHLTNFAVLTTASATQLSSSNTIALSIITYVGIALSLPCLLLTVAIFTIYSKLRNLARIIIMHLCLNLSAALALFVFGIDQTHDITTCTAVAVALHYFLLATFLWMLLEGVHLYKTFVVVFQNGPSNGSIHKRYALAAYSIPAIIVIVTGALLGQDAYGTGDACWLNSDNGAIWAFTGPVAVVVFLNIIFFILILRSILGVGLHHVENKQRAMLIRGLKVSAAFFCVMGITWIFGLLAISGNLGLQYIFTILNVLQGVFIFVFHCLRDRSVQDVVRGKKGEKFSTATSNGYPTTPSKAKLPLGTMSTTLSSATHEKQNPDMVIKMEETPMSDLMMSELDFQQQTDIPKDYEADTDMTSTEMSKESMADSEVPTEVVADTEMPKDGRADTTVSQEDTPAKEDTADAEMLNADQTDYTSTADQQ